jgi:hypothetical protein
MTREEKCLTAIEKGFKYDPETGVIFGMRGNPYIRKDSRGYILLVFRHNKKQIPLYGHQFAWYWVNKEIVKAIDHVNEVKNDNRIINLKSVTYQENKWNLKKTKGYHFYKKTNKYISFIRLKNKTQKYLGSFELEKDARIAYLEAKKLYHN